MRPGLVAFLVFCLAATGALAAGDVIVAAGDFRLDGATLAERLSRVSPLQLTHYGSTTEAQRQGYVEQVIVPELLFATEARARKLDEGPAVQARIRDALRDAMERALREELAATPVSQDEIKAYFESNRSRFETPKRIRIWRILVSDESKANEIISKAKRPDGLLRWSELAREHSLDKATALRNGDLGFVRPDGSTDAPRVKVAQEIVAAAEKLADGEVAAKPVNEGGNFAVIWRRGSMPESKRTLAQEEASIRQLLERRRAEDARNKLLQELKRDKLTEQHPELLEHIDAEAFAAPRKVAPKRDRAKADKLRRPKPAGSARR